MEKNIIFMDFENMQYITKDDIKPDTKIIVFVGHNQNKISMKFTMEHLDNVSSIDLIKIKRDVNVEQKNALDFFISHYLGIFIEKYISLDLNYIIYSDDQGFDPLIKHLLNNDIKIKRMGKNILEKNQERYKIERPNADENIVDKYYNKLIENIRKTNTKQRPKTRKGLEGRIKTLISGKNDDEKNNTIRKIMEKIIVNNKIKIDNNNKIKYNI
jgi:hypothetical protein